MRPPADGSRVERKELPGDPRDRALSFENLRKAAMGKHFLCCGRVEDS